MKISKRRISDAKIEFVSLVDKAANKRAFLITKEQDGKGSFSTFGKIVKTDSEHHFLTGIVYEPMSVDTQGDYMTAEDIQKAAYWYAKNGSGVDVQHNFEKFENAEVVESWIAKADFSIGDQKVSKGTWLMTVEVSDPDVWSAVEKGEITGFSMGGRGTYLEEDIDPDSLIKSESKGFFKKLAKMFGYEVVEKGEVADRYHSRNADTSFWDAFYSLQDTLFKYNQGNGKRETETDAAKIEECLTEFSGIVRNILSDGNVAIEKAGKTLSAKNIEKLKSAYESIGSLLAQAEGSEENMTKAETQELIENLVKKAVEKYTAEPEPDKNDNDDQLQKAVDAAVAKALEVHNSESVTKEDLAKMVDDAVAKAVEPLYKSRGIATNLNNEPEPVKKESDVFAGLFM